ncbi:hypothetical protein D3C84_1307320 [compost metagenome]
MYKEPPPKVMFTLGERLFTCLSIGFLDDRLSQLVSDVANGHDVLRVTGILLDLITQM